MKPFFRFFCLAAIASAAFISCDPKPLDDDGDNDNPVKPAEELKYVELNLVSNGCHALELEDSGSGSYVLKCNGADPYVYSSKLSESLEENMQILEFEYKCAESIDEFQIFFAVKGSPTEANSNKYTNLKSNTTDYVKFKCDMGKYRLNGFGKEGDRLRFDPGNSGSRTFYIRNIRIREMDANEKKIHDEVYSKEEKKIYMAEHLEKYLNTSYPSSVTKVSVTADKVKIEGSVSGSGDYLLADVTPWQDITELAKFPYTTKISGKNFSITLDRYVNGREGINYDRVFSKWAVVKVDGNSHILDSHARYADEVAAISSPAPLELKTKKGIGAGDHSYYFNDIRDMNAGSITMNVLLNNMVTGKGSDYQYGGVNYSIGSTRDYVDNITSSCKSMGTVISAIILCQTNSQYKDPENDGGYYTMPNITTAEAFNMYAAALEYMAKRYSSNDIGRISHWIMHNEVDSNSEWTNMGSQPMMRFLDRYVKSMRICYNIVRQYDQNAAVLGSYTHCWTAADGGFSSRKMLEKTVQYSKAEGDFWWGVAYHPYPQSLTRPEFWKNDNSSTYSMDSPYVTFKNLEVLSKWAKTADNLYKGEKKRIVFLSENGTNSPSYEESDLVKQAAGAAWAWKKVTKLDGIDAVQWHNWADNKDEGGLRIGLRAFAEGSFKNLDPKPAWYVWKAGGTSEEDAVFNQYLPTIGIGSWDEIMHEF